MKKLLLLIIPMTLVAPLIASAKCRLSVNQLEQIESEISWRNEKGEEDNTAVIRSDIQLATSKKKSGAILDYEAFIRPDHDDNFQILPIHLFMVDFRKSHDSVYICSHIDTVNEANSLTVVYFFRDGMFRTITPAPLPLREIRNLFAGPLENTPFMVTTIPLTIFAKIQEIFVHMFGQLTKIGIDRLRITSKDLQLYSGGNPAQFNQYVLKKVIPFNPKPEDLSGRLP